MKKIIVVALAAALFGPSASAQFPNEARSNNGSVAKGKGASATAPTKPQIPLDRRIASGRVAGFDIAGIRLGMTPQQAIDKATQAGFQMSSSSTASSFADRRLEALRKRRPDFAGTESPKVTREQFLKGPLGDTLRIVYAAMPDGPRVELVRYHFDGTKSDKQVFDRTILKKFGRPNGRATMYGNLAWCDHRCQRGEATAEQVKLVYNSVKIDGSVPAENHIRALIDADVERLTPKVRSGN